MLPAIPESGVGLLEGLPEVGIVKGAVGSMTSLMV
jgi:hypothetical protein